MGYFGQYLCLNSLARSSELAESNSFCTVLKGHRSDQPEIYASFERLSLFELAVVNQCNLHLLRVFLVVGTFRILFAIFETSSDDYFAKPKSSGIDDLSFYFAFLCSHRMEVTQLL